MVHSEFNNFIADLGISVAASTYHANKIYIFSAKDVQTIHAKRPMGLSSFDDRFAIGSVMTVAQYHNVEDLGNFIERPVPPEYDLFANHTDAYFCPTSFAVTGATDIHDVVYLASRELVFVNTRFSCLATLDWDYSFRPIWQPPFISRLVPHDNCHLNGVCAVNGRLAYVSAFSQTDEPQGWRGNHLESGILMEVPSGEVVIDNLSMPHSPREHDGNVYLLNSGAGELLYIDTQSSVTEVVARLPGFTRGLSFWQNYAFVGISEPRHVVTRSNLSVHRHDTAEAFDGLCGVYVIDLNSGEVVSSVKISEAKEIYDVVVLPYKRPAFIPPDHPALLNTFVFPDEVYA